MKKLLIIIPTALANANNLVETFVSLLKNTKAEYNLLIVKNDYKGFAPAANQGLAIVYADKSYDGCILVNDDVIFASDTWINKLLKEKDKHGIISCKNNINSDKNHVAFWCTYINRKVIDTIGFLDERFQIGEQEDVDYCFRAIDAGFKISDSKCEAFHKGSGTLQYMTNEGKKIIKENRKKLIKKYKGTHWEDAINNFWK